MSVQLPPSSAASTPGHQYANSLQKAGTPDKVAEQLVQQLKGSISADLFFKVSTGLRHLTKDQLAAVQQKIGALTDHGNAAEIKKIFTSALQNPDNEPIKSTLQKILALFSQANAAPKPAPQVTASAILRAGGGIKPPAATPATPANIISGALQSIRYPNMAQLRINKEALQQPIRETEQNILANMKILEKIDTLDQKNLVAPTSMDTKGLKQFIFDNAENIVKAVETSKMVKSLGQSPKQEAMALSKELKATILTLKKLDLGEAEGLGAFGAMCRQLQQAAKLLGQ